MKMYPLSILGKVSPIPPLLSGILDFYYGTYGSYSVSLPIRFTTCPHKPVLTHLKDAAQGSYSSNLLELTE